MRVIDTPLFIDSGDASLFAVRSSPEHAGDLGVLLLPAGGYTFTPQRNRWGADLAHVLASRGFATLRYDWEGIGDSTGSVDTFALDRPASGDVRAALAEMRTPKRVLMGQCYGARTAMAMAPETEGLAGVILISPPVRDHARGEGTATKRAYDMSAGGYLRQGAKKLSWSMMRDRAELIRVLRIARVFLRARWHKASARFRRPDPTPWVSTPFLRQLEWLISSNVPTLVVYGSDENDFREFEEAQAGTLGNLLDGSGPSFSLEVIPGSVHALDRVEVQEAVIGLTARWLDART